MKQLNIKAPEQLVLEINRMARSSGVGRDQMLHDVLRRALLDQQGSQRKGAQKSRRKQHAAFEFTFNFPKEVRTACEQYLLYFSEFLKEVGVNVRTEINAKTHSTLFRATPANSRVALEAIAEALRLYIALPQSPVMSGPSPSVGEKKFELMIHYLRDQFRLARGSFGDDRLGSLGDAVPAVLATKLLLPGPPDLTRDNAGVAPFVSGDTTSPATLSDVFHYVKKVFFPKRGRLTSR